MWAFKAMINWVCFISASYVYTVCKTVAYGFLYFHTQMCSGEEEEKEKNMNFRSM